MKIGICIIATGKYISFVGRLYQSARQIFLKDHERHFFVFTDKLTEAPEGTIPCYVKHESWPSSSSRRFCYFTRYKALLAEMDYLFYMDADMEVVAEVKDDILGVGISATLHKSWMDKLPNEMPYCRDPNSAACVKGEEGAYYYCGGFWGGRNKEFFELCEKLAQNVEADIAKGIHPINYDESHLNRYLIDHPPAKNLSWKYCSHPDFKNECIIMALIKDHVGCRQNSAGDAALVPKKLTGQRMVFVNYSNQLFRRLQLWNCINADGLGFESILSFSEEWLKTRPFYRENIEVLSLHRGGGYWLWKPYIISEAMKYMNDGDIVIYCDSADVLKAGYHDYAQKIINEKGVLLVENTPLQKAYCKRDTFILCDADNPTHWNAPQLEAGMVGLKKTRENEKFLAEWLKMCLNRSALTDDTNTCGQNNFPEFLDHRHDQSILTILAKKRNLPTVHLSIIGRDYISYDSSKTPRAYIGGLPNFIQDAYRKNNPDGAAKEEEMRKKYNIPVGFGPSHPRWNVPSDRNRYAKMMRELDAI